MFDRACIWLYVKLGALLARIGLAPAPDPNDTDGDGQFG